MIANRVGLLVAFAIACVLAVIVVIDTSRDQGVVSTALVEGFDANAVTRLAWSRSDEPEIVIARTGTAFRWITPYRDIAADPSAVDAVFAALRGGRWHRRDDRAGQAGMVRVALTVTTASRAMKIGIGAPLEGAGQTWLVIDDHALLVDDWVARALAPDPLALRETRPLRDAATANKIVIDRLMPSVTALTLEGTPRRLVKPIELMVASEPITALHEALSAMTIVAPTASPANVTTMAISLDAPLVTVEFYSEGGCPKPQVAIGGTLGKGCISEHAIAEINLAIDALRRPAIQLAEPRLVPFEPVAITLPDGVVLDLSKRPRVGDRDADSTKVAELLAMLATPIPKATDADPAIKPTATLTAVDRAGARIDLELLPDNRIRRRGEPIAREPGTGAYAILARPSSELRDPTLWNEEPVTIHAITVDTTTYTRGAVIGEWTRTGPGRDDNAGATALAYALSLVRGVDTKRTPRALHTITFDVVPPGGAPTKRTFTIGDRTPAGCDALVDGKPVLLETRICDAVTKLAAR